MAHEVASDTDSRLGGALGPMLTTALGSAMSSTADMRPNGGLLVGISASAPTIGAIRGLGWVRR